MYLKNQIKKKIKKIKLKFLRMYGCYGMSGCYLSHSPKIENFSFCYFRVEYA